MRKAIADLKDIDIREAQSLADLHSLGLAEARIVRGPHLYVELVNAVSLLRSDQGETVRCHKRLLRFLHLYQRVVHRLFAGSTAFKVDFQNHRLHAVVAGSANEQLECSLEAVRLAQILCGVLARVTAKDEILPDAQVCIGIETGACLAVRNGTRADREPLFLGRPANKAAKMLTGTPGIYLGPEVASVLGRRAGRMADDDLAPNIDAAIEIAVKGWNEELNRHPLKSFEFSAPALPLSDVDLDTLSPSKSKRGQMASIFADIDGFSGFVESKLAQGQAADAARVLHVTRKELRDTLNVLGGRKVRYHGDCLQGVVAASDSEETATLGVKAAAAMLDAFELVREELADARELGLAVGSEMGPVALTRLGVRGKLDRCAAGLSVIESEELQRSCSRGELRIGPRARAALGESLARLFDHAGRARGLTYNAVGLALDVGSPAATNGAPGHASRAHSR